MKSVEELKETFDRFKGMTVHRTLGTYPTSIKSAFVDADGNVLQESVIKLAEDGEKHGGYKLEDVESDPVERKIIEAIKAEGLEFCVAGPDDGVYFDLMDTVYVYLDLPEGVEFDDTMIGKKVPLVVDEVVISDNFSQPRALTL